MKKTRRFVALLLAAVLALALFTACGAAGQPQPTIGEKYEKWFVEQLNSKQLEGKTVQKVDVKHSEMMAALEKLAKTVSSHPKMAIIEMQAERKRKAIIGSSSQTRSHGVTRVVLLLLMQFR